MLSRTQVTTTLFILLFIILPSSGCKKKDDPFPGPFPPAKVTNPSPADTATNVPIWTVLDWSPASTADSYDVYFGTSMSAVVNATTASAEFMENNVEGSFDPGDLECETTYYWRIDSASEIGTTTGDIWMFTTPGPIYVDDTLGDDLNSGTTPASPLKTIQAGIDAAIEGTMVLVVPGTYSGTSNVNLDFGGKDIWLLNSLYKESTSPNPMINCASAARAFHFHSGETRNSRIHRIEVMSGLADGEDGGAVLIENSSSPTFDNCQFFSCFTDNSSVDTHGAGIASLNSSPLISECTFSSCLIATYGGAIYAENSLIKIDGCTIFNCTADNGGAISLRNTGSSGATMSNTDIQSSSASIDGGGIYVENADLIINNCTVSNCSAAERGGAIRLKTASVTINFCSFTDSDAGFGGAAALSQATGYLPSFNHCIFSGNTATTAGGGVYCQNAVNPTFFNCLVIENTTNGTGAGLVFDTNCNSTLTNLTITENNNSGGNAGGIYAYQCTLDMVNCIILGNSASGLGDQFMAAGSSSTVINLYYCCYSNAAGYLAGGGTFSPTNSITDDPLWIAGPNGDYYLEQTAAGDASDSPCMDAGSNTAENLSLDEYTTRKDDVTDTGTVDIGFHYKP